MTLFALLHGGMHRGSSWALVAAGLVEHGHQVIAPDLPMDDDAAGAREWARVAIDAIERTRTDNVIVVGHSLAGLCVPVVATHHPVHRMVFVGGLLPVPGRRFVNDVAERANSCRPGGLSQRAVRVRRGNRCGTAFIMIVRNSLPGRPSTNSVAGLIRGVYRTMPSTECWAGGPQSIYVPLRTTARWVSPSGT